MKKRIVILTTHFGTNYSGGSTATCEIFSRIQEHFSGPVVLGTALGDHPFKSLKFIEYKNWLHAIAILKRLNDGNTIFYGDFYNSFLLVQARVKFYFTYHDNWPDLRLTSISNYFKSIFYTHMYHMVFKGARHVFTVSERKLRYIQGLSTNASLVRNGFTKKTRQPSSDPQGVIMVGNVDRRKYGKALKLFERLAIQGFGKRIDIYGHIHDKELGKRLAQFPFVNLKGFRKEIPYSEYQILLHTSVMENLPIVFCEAIYNQLKVLAFDVGGSSEIVIGSAGLLIPPYDIEDMSSSLKAFSDNPAPNETPMLSEDYSWDVASSKYYDTLFTQT